MVELYAKSANRAGSQRTLFGHLVDTEQSVLEVFAPGSRWRAAWLRFFRISAAEHERFWITLRVAALFHDIGKANEDFQNAVSRPGRTSQTLRHEHISALVLSLPECREWLGAAVDPDMVTAAVLSHHLKAAHSHPDYSWGQARTAPRVELYLQHEQVAATFRRVQKLLALGAPPALPQGAWHERNEKWSEALQLGRANAQKFRRALRKDDASERRRYLAALKSGLIVADSVASAMVREDKDRAAWVEDNANRRALSPRDIEEAILEPRAKQLEERSRRPFQLQTFQVLAGREGARTLLLAPCGAGKTIAAWEWAKKQVEEREVGRVLFLYPTRGTATEGFRDYVGWAPEGDAKLLHASSKFELTTIAENPPESLAGKNIAVDEAAARLFALGLWQHRYFSATVDQFMAFLQNRYDSLCLLPALADSVIIIDEVHSFDPRMFELLLTFLEQFDVPVLCMTATLPNERRGKLTRLLTEFPRPEHDTQLPDLDESASHPRYRIRFEPSADAAVDVAVSAFRRGKRVLVVVNRVARCLEVAQKLNATLAIKVMVYHSRFQLRHRQDRHREVVDAFKSDGAAIAVTTQVCEMSLDLDAQVLVTELAPVPSLIQRLGRANRHLKDKATPADVVVYPPATHAPYEIDDIQLAESFVRGSEGLASQAKLAELLNSDSFSKREVIQSDYPGALLEGGYYALPSSFREEDEFSVQCVCDGDLAELKRLVSARLPLDGYILPVPRNHVLKDEQPPWLPRHVHVAPSARYSEDLGFQV